MYLKMTLFMCTNFSVLENNGFNKVIILAVFV